MLTPYLSLPAPLILGSQSPRRRQLLAALEVPFEVMVRPTDEIVPDGATPDEAVQHIALQKALAFEDLKQHYLILTADTIVVLGDEILGKPQDAEDAFEILQKLSRKMHSVKTAVCLLHKEKCVQFIETTQVYFRELETEEIRHYIRHYRPFDKAGAYGAQEWVGMAAVPKIEGDFYNVMGLPVSRLYAALRNWELL